jgi:hypothetical protein
MHYKPTQYPSHLEEVELTHTHTHTPFKTPKHASKDI